MEAECQLVKSRFSPYNVFTHTSLLDFCAFIYDSTLQTLNGQKYHFLKLTMPVMALNFAFTMVKVTSHKMRTDMSFWSLAAVL